MAHDIARINGIDSMFAVGGREAAWHQLGQRINQAATWEQAIKLANLDWQVKKQDLYARALVAPFAPFKVPDTQAIIRDTDSAYLGCVGTGYEPIQNREAFDFMDAVIGERGGAHYETAGALGSGERIWVLARVPGADIRIHGTDDVSRGYLLVATAHDGSMSYLAKLCAERVVCANTLAVALGESSKAVLRIKHTRSAKDRLALAQKLLQGVVKDADALSARLNALAQRRMTKDTMVNVMNRLFPENKEAQSDTRRMNLVTKVLELFESNDGNAVPQIRGTAYNLLNAVTEYTDHFRTARLTSGRDSVDKARAEAALFGTGDRFKSDALVAVLEETEACPAHDLGGVVMSNADLQKLYEL